MNNIKPNYGRLKIIKEAPIRKNHRYMLCQCECGTIKEVALTSLKQGFTLSCGCFGKEQRRKALTTHGLTKTPEYWVFQHMHQRCENPKDAEYHNYGKRGICVSPRWKTVDVFYKDMGPRPSPQHSLDRIDNNKGYYPENCRWTTSQTQNNNKRVNKIISFQGESLTVTQWATKLGWNPSIIYSRLRDNWNIDDTLSYPIIRGGWAARRARGWNPNI
jgi:hypothetical protein